ncbi:MAG: putative ATP-dependent helicase DinG [Rhodocyclaceae bacterium]|nr:ATP-dependent DNA helicase [Zoogloeaceae bacterium]MBV6407528.1 putative ATP-dependent helicase DinG [Rhodocyclaceae bacterium]MCK6384436.1 ATP-dependent DNA helicase [Rhodocyclaceae bacterium]
MPELSSVFAVDGALARAIPGYRVRPQQVEMAQRIAAAIEKHGVLVAEAGTGTGKTFAYLVPALAAGGKVIVSTGTKTLQDQLFERDLPTVRDALKAPATIALLKGRANYVCHYHLERARTEGRFLSREEAGHILAIVRFAKTTTTGDKAECAAVPEDSGAWAQATSTRDNCLGQDCPNAKECFVTAARREAQAADVVVVNHHLFFADVMLRDSGVAELLPACNTVIFDEAHQLPETASLFFGESVSTAQLVELARDARLEGIAAAKDFKELPDGARALEKAARDLRLAVPGENARFSASQLPPAFLEALEKAAAELAHFGALLETQAARSEGLEHCWRRAQELQAVLKRWRDVDEPGLVRWAEVFSQALSLNATPLVIADIFKKQMEGPNSQHRRAWIFTSATLAVESDFSHYCNELGLNGGENPADTGCWGSPFDYPNQALLYAPQAMPDPNSREYNEAVVEAAWPLIHASRGRAFVLCTSLRAMRRIHELLKARFEAEGFDHPLLLQGEGSKSELLARFRRLGNAVLVASQSFWEGVDVRGEALQLVIIDKLPFAPPDDPVLAARIEHMKRQGRNAFMEYQLPRAVISVKQGAGRLIRDESDRGVLMICDPRLIAKPYGKRVWRSLPPMRRTREEDEALAFFEARVGEAEAVDAG